MTNETWIITGANRGLGLELARRVAERGNAVIATARRPDEARELADLGVRVEALDVADDDSVARFVAAVGDAPVDVLVNNAGAMERAGDFGSIDLDAMRRQFDVNTLGPLRVTQALLPALRRGGRRLVAHLSSKMGSIEDNTSGGSYSYRTSKAALNMVNRSMAHDLAGDGVTALVLHPGWVRTDMGGDAAPLSIEDSVAGMLRVLDAAGPERSGRFFAFDGEELPW